MAWRTPMIGGDVKNLPRSQWFYAAPLWYVSCAPNSLELGSCTKKLRTRLNRTSRSVRSRELTDVSDFKFDCKVLVSWHAQGETSEQQRVTNSVGEHLLCRTHRCRFRSNPARADTSHGLEQLESLRGTNR